MFRISIYFFVLILLSAGQVQKSNKKVKATPITLPLRRDVAVTAHPSSISTINRLYSAFCFGSIWKLSVFVVSIYFLCLDAKKVTKKNQGKHPANGGTPRVLPYHALFFDEFWQSILFCLLL